METKIKTRSEILSRVAELGIETIKPAAQMKSGELLRLIIEAEAELNKANSGRTGRPVDPNSERQKRLAEIEAKRAAGELRKGRPVDPNSKRQLEIAAKNEIKAEIGELPKGRPVDPDSARQKRLAELEAKRELGLLRRGRPKQDLAIEIIDDVPVEAEIEIIEATTEEVGNVKKSKRNKAVVE